MVNQLNHRSATTHVRAFVGIILIAIVAATGSASEAGAAKNIGVLAASNKSASVAVGDGGDSTCSADVWGAWSGRIAFEVTGSQRGSRPVVARAHSGAEVETTTKNGSFFWEAPAGTACLLTMTSYDSGTAVVDLTATRVPALMVAQAMPSYIPWYYNVSPTPSPITGAYASIGGAFGAGNIYNTATNGFGTPGTGTLFNGQCYFLCYGAPGVASSNVIAMGNEFVTPGPTETGSFTTLGAPDDCSSTGSRLCPGGVKDEVFGIEGYAAPTATPTVLIAIDSNANFAVYGGFYAGAAVIAGAGTGTAEPSPSPGSLVSFTGPGNGDLLLGSATSYVKCDYGETAGSKLTCNAPLNIDGPLRSAVSTSSTPGPVPPCYEHNGTKCADTFHSVKNTNGLGITTNGSCSNNTWCSLSGASVSFTGSDAPFANNKYTCALSSQSASLVNLTANSQMATGFTIQAYNSSGSSIANNTDLGISYACFGI